MKALDNDARMDVKWFLLWAGVGAVNRPVSPAGGDPEGPGVDTKGMSHPLVGGHARGKSHGRPGPVMSGGSGSAGHSLHNQRCESVRSGQTPMGLVQAPWK